MYYVMVRLLLILPSSNSIVQSSTFGFLLLSEALSPLLLCVPLELDLVLALLDHPVEYVVVFIAHSVEKVFKQLS